MVAFGMCVCLRAFNLNTMNYDDNESIVLRH